MPGKECDLICQMKEIKTCIYEVGAKVPNGALCTNNGSYRCVNGNCKVTLGSRLACESCLSLSLRRQLDVMESLGQTK